MHLGYAIGRAQPISVMVDSFGTGRIAEAKIEARLVRTLDFRPAAIAHRFGLREAPRRAGAAAFYRPLAVYGQLGRTDLDVRWERDDAAAGLRA